MRVTFEKIRIGGFYSRPDLAHLWGYSGYQALARGVVTPRDDNKIILFVTIKKAQNQEQYKDQLLGDTLYWEGPTDHFAESRIIGSNENGDQIYLFLRKDHLGNFKYEGAFKLEEYQLFSNSPSKFVFRRRST